MRTEQDDIRRYHEGTLTEAERYALEKKALTDPFLADALEGLESVTPAESRADLEKITGSIQKRSRAAFFSPIRIAAGIAVLLGAAALFYFPADDEPPIAALEQQAPPPAGDSSAQIARDTSSQLLTMAEPDAKSPDVTSQPATKKDPVKQPGAVAEVSAASGGPASGEVGVADEDKTDTHVAEKVVVAADEAKRVEEEKADEVRVAPSLSVADSKAELSQKKAAGAARSLQSKESFASTSARKVSGIITTPDGEALPGANVMLKGTSVGAVSDVNGRYSLPVPEGNNQLVVSFIGMKTSEVETGNNDQVNVQLDEDVSQLSEVVVAGYGTSKDDREEPVIRMAAPVGGMRAYNKYLEKNLRYPKAALDNKIEGKVTIRFTVKTNGKLSDFSVQRGLGYGCDEEVVRLVKEGPRWNPTYKDDVAVESEVRVKMKFDPDKAGQ